MITTVADAPSGLQKLKERHHEIKRRLIAGELQTDIAHSLGMTDSWISIVVNDPTFQRELQTLRAVADVGAADVRGRITKLAPEAMKVIEDAILTKQDAISQLAKVRIAQDVLDRAGHGAIQKSISASSTLTAKDIEEIKQRRMRLVSPDASSSQT